MSQLLSYSLYSGPATQDSCLRNIGSRKSTGISEPGTLQRGGPTKTLFETREMMRLIAGGNLTSFHSVSVSVSAVGNTKQLTVPLECQLVCKSKLDLLLHAAQDVGHIANKLGTSA